MYSLVQYVVRWAITRPERNILLLGLDNAGKTTLLNVARRMFGLEAAIQEPVLPTVGQNYAKFTYRGIKWTLWDLGGQRKFRRSWRHYYRDADVIFFVVDASERQRFDEALGSLKKLMTATELMYAPVCLCANKGDVMGFVEPEEIREVFYLDELAVDRRVNVQATSGQTQTGVREALDWAVHVLKRDHLGQERILLRKRLKRDDDTTWGGPNRM